jgi:hypothetical protein
MLIHPFAKCWISVCSVHQESDPKCDLCKCGSWHNIWLMMIDNYLFKIFPGLWKIKDNYARTRNKSASWLYGYLAKPGKHDPKNRM